MDRLLEAEQDMHMLQNPELSKNATHTLGKEVIRLLQEENTPEVSYERLSQLMIENGVSLSEDTVHVTLRGLHDSGYIKINLFDANVGMYRNDDNAIVNNQTGDPIV